MDEKNRKIYDKYVSAVWAGVCVCRAGHGRAGQGRGKEGDALTVYLTLLYKLYSLVYSG